MENRLLTAALAASIFAAPASATTPLGAKDMTYVFVGREVKGEYANTVPFSEVYHVNGTIDYAEGDTHVKGRWKIDGTQFCTTYDGLPGGCFNIVARGSNCFEYWLLDAAGKTAEKTWIARGWQSKYPATCPPR